MITLVYSKKVSVQIYVSLLQSVSIPVLFFFFGEFLSTLGRIEETKIASKILNLAKEDYSILRFLGFGHYLREW